ncbi:MAG: hypothetical protein GY739_18510 [Mesoflavibacter sp.]|nr:hypothetical protein [Mesoflavibacter sp.]
MKEKKIIEIDPETTKLCFKCLKWTYGRSSIDYRVALLFTGWGIEIFGSGALPGKMLDLGL